LPVSCPGWVGWGSAGTAEQALGGLCLNICEILATKGKEKKKRRKKKGTQLLLKT